MKKYFSALIAAIVFSGPALAAENKIECVERVGKECIAKHGSDFLGFNADYHECLAKKLPLCPEFGK
ncbi:hypothetical protein BRY73_15505 [Ochrobactrum sp. P6BS-III]|uniref:hypothetical protein n=1 Tax=unclassified Ochrobactrum TaxID=239106 RepID=UPI0009940FC3|nr:hypothetical protein [Ochrobactrum sp. P6BSIII]OOL16146.1 hypothetical protein BRY73_15505 [Ochrobactrum sp. P6BS-III]